ncbi:MAG: HAD-IIIA family hydrolase [Fusobacterium sp.]|nr:HAD-IIIA family hydrolase [Fusobacterium sp.]
MESIKIVVLDVDGTLTDGKLYIDNQNNEFKAFNVRDGFAITNWIKLGGEVAILTGKSSNIVERRAKELGIKHIIQGSKNKSKDLAKLLKKLKLSFEEVAYMGDDINDMGVMLKVLLPACPQNADKEVMKISSYISPKNGGDGAVRDFFEYIMTRNGMWEEVILNYVEE